MRTLKYAGIGSRKTPLPICEYMRSFAMGMALRGVMLRSGGAERADKSFEHGCNLRNGPKQIFYPSDATSEALTHAAKFHPNWHACTDWAQNAHARNSMIILGKYLNDPVNFVVCWTQDGLPIGGTSQALRVANAYNIPVFNLARPVEIEQLQQWLVDHNVK